MEDLINSIIESLDRKSSANELLNMGKDYTAIPIDNKNYADIAKMDVSGISGKQLSFIDGGQAILFDTPSLAIAFLRIGSITYSGKERILRNMVELYVLVKRIDEHFIVQTFPKTQFDGLKFGIDEEGIAINPSEGILPKSIVSIIRRCSELEYASKFNNPVIDGTLEALSKNELRHVLKLKNAIAISKTCTLTLNTGESVVKRLGEKEGAWFYNPIVQNNNQLHPADICFARLHERSRNVLRIEFLNIKDNSGEYIMQQMQQLSNISMDPIFLGYPYGLIDVDSYVRVSNEEQEYLRTKIAARLGRHMKSMSMSESSMNGHAILDSVKF